jgi:hypothetical protein
LISISLSESDSDSSDELESDDRLVGTVWVEGGWFVEWDLGFLISESDSDSRDDVEDEDDELESEIARLLRFL